MAYYSDQGVAIHSGAAGLGQDSGDLMAYRSGSLGQDSGDLMAFRSGSLGQDGQLMAFRDGSLGQDSGDLMAFRSGSLGHPLFIDGHRVEDPTSIYHGPPRATARPRGATAGCGCGPMRGLGQAPAVFDMQDPDVVRQVKNLMALIVGPTLNDNPQGWTQEMFSSGVWGKDAKNYAGQWIVIMGATVPADLSSLFVPPELYPNATGVLALMQLAAPIFEKAPEGEAERVFPDIVAFVAATGGDASKGAVAPPPTSELFRPATMAAIGVGAAAVVGLIWWGSRGRRRKSS